MAFRCAVASLGRAEPLVGSASTVRAFLLVENDGPWGADALRDARLDERVRVGLQTRAAAAGVRVLLVRRHRGADPSAGTRVFAAWADAVRPWLESGTLHGPDEMLALDLEGLGRGTTAGLTRTDEPVFCVCTHGRHDACCAELGRPTAAALTLSHPEHTWEVSHVGGDRFAANLLVLPQGLYYGRVEADEAPGLAAAHLEGRLDLDHLRGRSGLAFPAQVAEVAVRRETGVTRTDAVRLVSSQRSGEDTSVVLDVDGTSYDVVVRCTQTEATQLLTCRAARENPAPTYEVVRLRRSELPE
jgi:hypothetical protein